VRRRVLWQRTRVAAGVVLACALLALLFGLFAANWRPSPKDFPVQGVDVTAAQGPIDWWKVKAGGVDFAYARASVGARGRDTRFRAYWRGLYQAAIPHGAIHVFSLCQLSADQAGNFLRAVPRHPELLPVALDLDFEPDCPARPARAVVIGEIAHFLAVVEASTGQRAVLKITRRFEEQYRVSETIRRPLWSAAAFFPPAYFDKPWTMWQASSFRRIDGVNGAVNWDVMAK
jgi:lysozyme